MFNRLIKWLAKKLESDVLMLMVKRNSYLEWRTAMLESEILHALQYIPYSPKPFEHPAIEILLKAVRDNNHENSEVT